MTAPEMPPRRNGSTERRASWTLVAPVLFAVLIVVLLGLIFLRGLESQPATALPSVATLGAVVGVVGAIGGIVVGLTSLFALFQIDRQVEAAFERQFAAYQQRLRDESTRSATGLRFWTQAMVDVADGNLDRAQRALQQALDVWPEAPGARTEMTQHLWTAQQRAYIFWLRPHRRDQVMSASAHGYSTPTPVQPRWEDTFAWWRLAVDREPEARPELSRIGIGLYALQHNVEQMVWWLQEALAADPQWQPTDADFLTWGSCWDTLDIATRVQSLLPVASPIQEADAIVTQLKEAAAVVAKTMPGRRSLQYWLVVPKRYAGPLAPVIRIVALDGHDDRGWSVSRYTVDGKPIDEQPTVLDDDEALQRVLEDFAFVRQIPY